MSVILLLLGLVVWAVVILAAVFLIGAQDIPKDDPR